MTASPEIRVARARDDAAPGDGARILIDRLWPRGVDKARLADAVWIREIAPSTGLRQWFGHEPARWDEFRRRYRAELDANPAAVNALLDRCRAGRVTLLYAARDPDRNNATVLRDYLAERLAGGQPAVDPQDAAAVARWRKAERVRLLAERAALSVAARHEAALAVAHGLDRLLEARFGDVAGLAISAWWPIKAELNLRHWLEAMTARGATIALPVVIEPGTPLVFRRWTPHCRMVQGFWRIPVPADGPEVVPDVTLSPVVGWDAQGFRLGYGGGYFDRTLAALSPRPFAIGIGLQSARVPTIFPQPHDIAMNVILTEDGVQAGT